MKIFRHTNGKLYSIEQRGWGTTITRPEKWDWWYGIPYKTNRDAPVIEVGKELNLNDFSLEFEI